MTILIPVLIVGLIVGAFGLYFAYHEGRTQQAKALEAAIARLPHAPAPPNADIARLQQSAQIGPQGQSLGGVSLHH
jgi:hypothetical protein